MKTMLMFDLLTAKKIAMSQMVLGVVVSLVIAVSTQTPMTIMPIMALMLAYSVGFTLVAYDERNDWERFRLTLPLSRADIIRGRYGTFVIMTLVGLAVGALLTAIVYGLAQAMPDAPILSALSEPLGWQVLLAMAVASIAFSLVLWLIALPLVARFGMTKAVRFIPLAFIILLPLGTALAQKAGPPPAFVVDLVTWALTSEGTIVLALAVLAFVAVLSALSCLLSVKLYEKREF
ncbi:ABC-2 transporter permease [Gordonibacter sp. 28C]|uniref:ABC-2 transporter permease n=1 Tax=Gordonibacter sp. 28C TaxID=2078569 RepID=UPI000DF85D0A|nr:ABC-2 transporter permease [Gordonibacter sp. 28C]RDB61578.1 ABC-2 transporter permease [Gordonibacter sp. 28C]